MKSWKRLVGYALVIALVGGVYYIGIGSRGDNGADNAALLAPEPGYAARDAEVIETGYDGRERYRLNAKVIRQKTETGLVELENLEMNYRPGAQERVAGEAQPADAAREVWHLTSDHGQVRADGDDVQLTGNVRVTGPAPGSGAPLQLSTEELRMNTPTQFIETDAPVKLTWTGHELVARGMSADLKAGTIQLKSDVHGQFDRK